MEQPLTVGQLARATGVSAKTIRYYEQAGVLPAPRRSPSGYRQYARRDTHRLLFIRRARALGLSLKDLKTLATEVDNGQCGTMRPKLSDLIQNQLQTVRQRMAEFQLLQLQLEQVLHRLSTAAPSNPAEGCQCLEQDVASSIQESPPSCTSTLGEKTMDTRNTLESYTIIGATDRHDGHCGCGCGCEFPITPSPGPQDALASLRDEEDDPSKQP